MIETKLIELVSDELNQFYKDSKHDNNRFKLLLVFEPAKFTKLEGLGNFTIPEPKRKFQPKVTQTTKRSEPNNNIF